MSSEQSAAKLVVQREQHQDRTVEIDDALTIGRSPSNQLMLEDTKVSRRHAEIRLVAPGRYRLTDLGSANGTWINRRRLTSPCDLQNGDLIQIGASSLRFETTATAPEALSCSAGTAPELQDRYVVTLVADIQKYTTMSETLPGEKFSLFVKDWFKECSGLVESHGGAVDKFIGDAIMCYWLVLDRDNPAMEAGSALAVARELIGAAETFSGRLSGIFPGHAFAIGVGISMGSAIVGNVGTGANQSITLVGDSVNIAFRLEALTRQKNSAVIVTGNIAECAPAGYAFVDLGQAEVKGRKKPVAISALVTSPGNLSPL